jgi:hypothetical protein
MDILKTKTVTGTSGNTSVSSGLNHAQILGVFRAGEQKDDGGFVSLGSLDGSNWVFILPNRISFGTFFPFLGTESIRIIYKETS